MGIIRFLLAFSVVIAHYQYFSTVRLVGGELAVQGFFILSGFYIALILDKSYSSIPNFLINRFLRLWPVYIVIAGINFIINLMEPGMLVNIFTFPATLYSFLIFTNTTMLFQDLTMFLGLQDGHLHFVGSFLNSNPVLFPYLLIAQAWTLGVELSFYILAPLLFCKNYKFIYIIFIASLIARVYLLQHGSFDDPWNYRFFPTELALFMLGAMAYALYRKIPFSSNIILYEQIGKILLTLVLAYMFFFRNISIGYELGKGVFYLLLAVSIPFIFFLTKNNKIDNFIGNLSYPIYLLWGLKISPVPFIIKLLGTNNPKIEGLVFYLWLILLAIIMHVLIEMPMEKIRARFRMNKISS